MLMCRLRGGKGIGLNRRGTIAPRTTRCLRRYSSRRALGRTVVISGRSHALPKEHLNVLSYLAPNTALPRTSLEVTNELAGICIGRPSSDFLRRFANRNAIEPTA